MTAAVVCDSAWHTIGKCLGQFSKWPIQSVRLSIFNVEKVSFKYIFNPAQADAILLICLALDILDPAYNA